MKTVFKILNLIFMTAFLSMPLKAEPLRTDSSIQIYPFAQTCDAEGGRPYDQQREFGSWNKYYGYGLVDAHAALLATPKYWKK